MNPYRHFIGEIEGALRAMQAAGELPAALDFSAITAEPPRDPAHGDIATNAAMVLAKAAGKKPRDIAEPLLARLKANPDVVDGSVAGPGFINLKISDAFWRARLRDCLKEGIAYGDSTMGGGEKVNVEYVSANPTGPLHVAHARGAVVGDALANLLAKAGYAVTKEYYINDAGAQVDTLGRSTFLRYKEALGEHIGTIPEGLYPGEYLKDVGAAIAKRDGARWIDKPEADWLPEMRAFAIATLMADIKTDLETLGVNIEVYSSERALVESGMVDRVFQESSRQGLIYQGRLEPPKGKKPDDWEDREQTLFRATKFGDDVDRPLKKSDGTLDLLRQRHRLPLRQVPPRLCRHDRRLGRRPWRLRQAPEGGGEGHHRRQGRARRQALPARARDAERRAGPHVQARRYIRHTCAICSTRSGPMSCGSRC